MLFCAIDINLLAERKLGLVATPGPDVLDSVQQLRVLAGFLQPKVVAREPYDGEVVSIADLIDQCIQVKVVD